MNVKLYLLKPRKNIPENQVYENIKNFIDEIELSTTYEDYMKLGLLWATESHEKIAKELNVKKIVPKGGYIMGLFGGEKKSGEERYGGLVVEKYDFVDDNIVLKFYNLDNDIIIPINLLKEYDVDIYKIYYSAYINPFKCIPLKIILPNKKEENLKQFIKKIIKENKKTLTPQNHKKLEMLAEELKISIDVFDDKASYVVYRCVGIFSACVPQNLVKTVSESHISYIECENVDQAYFYVGVLNYLAFKIIQEKRKFIRHQFARPLLAIILSELTWNNTPNNIKKQISILSKKISKKIKWKKYKNQKKALIEISNQPEFKKIIKILDNHIKKENKQTKLKEALNLISTAKYD